MVGRELPAKEISRRAGLAPARRVGPALVAAFLAVLPVRPAAADGIPAAFVGVQVLGLDDAQVATLEQALEEGLARDRRFAVVSRKDPALRERCQGKPDCFCREGRRLQVSHLVYANVGHIPPLYTFELVLLETQSCAVVSSVFVSERHDLAAARARISELATRLLKPKEEVSETAAKGERDVGQVPAVVTVITDRQIQQLGITSLPELFRLVPGFEVVDLNSGDMMLHHGLASTLLYMVDGVPLSNSKVNFAVFGQDFRLGINHVERIEFVRGPGSVLWGQNAFLGIVNLITRTPQAKGERVRAHLRLSTLDSQEFFASLEGNRRWVSYWLSATWLRERGPRTRVKDSLWADLGVDAPVWGNAGTTHPDPDTYLDVVAKVRLLGRLELMVQYFSSLTHYEISPFGSLLPEDEPGFWDTSNLLYAASWEDRLPRGFRYRLSASRYEHGSWELFQVHPKSSSLPYGFWALQGNELDPELNHLLEARLYHTWQRGSLSNRGLLGFSYLHQLMPDQWITLTLGQEEGTEELDMASHTFNTVSGYLQDDFSLLDGRLVMSGGLRYDWHDPFQSALSAQGGILGGVERLHGKLTYAEGFRPPSMNNLYSTTGVKGDPNLRPERSRAISAEVTGRPWGPLTLQAGGTVAWLDDLIKQETLNDPNEPQFTSLPVNRSSMRIYSGYGELRLAWPWLDAWANYTFKQHSASDPVDANIPLAAHTAAAGASLRPLARLNIFGTLAVVGPRTVQLMTPVGVVEERVKAYALLDLGFTVSNLLRMFDFTIRARNPARYVWNSPYRVDGRPVPHLERRMVSEILFTLGWSRAFAWETWLK